MILFQLTHSTLVIKSVADKKCETETYITLILMIHIFNRDQSPQYLKIRLK